MHQFLVARSFTYDVFVALRKCDWFDGTPISWLMGSCCGCEVWPYSWFVLPVILTVTHSPSMPCPILILTRRLNALHMLASQLTFHDSESHFIVLTSDTCCYMKDTFGTRRCVETVPVLVDVLIASLSCEQFLGFSLLRKGQKLRFKGLAEDPQSVTDPVLVSYKEIKSTTLR